MLKKIRHVGIEVKDLVGAIEKFKGFGLELSEIREVRELGVQVAFFPIGDTLIELVYYVEPDKLDRNVFRSQKSAINHICFEVEDLDQSIQDFEKSGAKLVEGYPKSGAHGRVAFFYPETTENALVEICQMECW